MAQESSQEFKARMLEQMRDLGFAITASTDTTEGKWVAVRDTEVDKSWERSGRFQFGTSRTGAPSCMFKSMKRDLPTDFKRGDLSFEFARGSHDKSVERTATVYKEPTLNDKLTLDPVYRAEMQSAVDKTKDLWAASFAIKEHGYLKKPDLDPARIRQTADGRLLVPIFRPAAPSLSTVELAGAQLISDNGFKQFLPGTKSGGGFALVPAHPDPNKWMDHLSKSAKPLVLCEGVGTALAIHQATGYPVVACLSAKNLPLVAEWLKHEGYTQNRDVVICADNDLDKTRTGADKRESDKFIGIKEACKAAEITGGKVALTDNDRKGYDAKDLMRDGGDQAVACLINDPRSIAQIKQARPEIFSSFEVVRSVDVAQEEEIEFSR